MLTECMYKSLPTKKYSIIYADPPWNYRDIGKAGKRGASYKYSTIEINELKKFPIDLMCEKNCALFLWVTMPQLQNAIDLIKAWNFKYKTCAFTWIKLNRKDKKPFIGMGHYTRANAELCLLAMRGKLKRVSASVRSVIQSPICEHSKKPDEVRERIVNLFGDIPRIELFARQITEGWDCWGDEIN